jgi:hypothetical protein
MMGVSGLLLLLLLLLLLSYRKKSSSSGRPCLRPSMVVERATVWVYSDST